MARTKRRRRIAVPIDGHSQKQKCPRVKYTQKQRGSRSPLLIGIIGKKGSGKDTFADHLTRKYKFKKMAFADPLKSICSILFNFKKDQLYGDKKEEVDSTWGITPRSALQFVGTDLFRDQMHKLIPGIDLNIWLENMSVRLKDYYNTSHIEKRFVVVSDVRFQNEVDLIKDKGGYVIKLERPSLLKGNECNDTHRSESEMDNIQNYDEIIVNDGTKRDLYKKSDDYIASHFINWK